MSQFYTNRNREISDQRIVTAVVEIASRLYTFVSVVGEIGSCLVCPCCRRRKLTGTEAISDS
jgi:hypothetical protein